jgi:hypothetical protein
VPFLIVGSVLGFAVAFAVGLTTDVLPSAVTGTGSGAALLGFAVAVLAGGLRIAPAA